MTLNFNETYKLSIVGSINGSLKDFVTSIKTINTVFILTGDNNFGSYGYSNMLNDLILLEYTLSKNNNYLLFLRGNNDNPKYFKKKSSFKNELSDNAPHIILLSDYSIIHTHNYSILCIGGAYSIDRSIRIKDHNYWFDENVKAPDINFYNNLEKDNVKINMVVSHTAPLFAPPIEFSSKQKHHNSYLLDSWSLYDKDIKNDVYNERLFLKNLYDILSKKNSIKYWIYGHYHKSIETMYNNTKVVSLGLKEIKNIK